MPDYVETFDLVALPYPTAFGLFRAHKTPSPFVTMTNRLVVIRFRDFAGAGKTLLFEPSDVELGENAPFYKELSEKTPKILRSLGVRKFDSVERQLLRIGIDPKEVDYLAFDHLHIQDVRRLVGTRGPAPDISPNGPVPPLFPNARLIVQEAELSLLREMHPIQAPWYQPETYRDLRPEGLLPITGDMLLGPGVALLSTPGHASGNQSLVLNTSTGIWAMSENVIAAELLTPELSRIPGVAASAKRWGNEVILNANTIEATALQYNSVIKEKSIVDRSSKDGRSSSSPQPS
jgi:glyoxylase-like metal-dependent hydrolase (beta-lactamase superfamily II)